MQLPHGTRVDGIADGPPAGGQPNAAGTGLNAAPVIAQNCHGNITDFPRLLSVPWDGSGCLDDPIPYGSPAQNPSRAREVRA